MALLQKPWGRLYSVYKQYPIRLPPSIITLNIFLNYFQLVITVIAFLLQHVATSKYLLNMDLQHQENDAFNPNMWYRLKNAHMPSTHCLDIVNDHHTAQHSSGLLKIARDGYYAGQYWQIKPNGDGTYFLRTWWLGPTRQLDVDAQDGETPVMQSVEQVLGQRWRIEAWGDGTWLFENGDADLGHLRCLDTVEDARGEGGVKVKMIPKDEGRAMQRWTVTPIREITEPGY